MSEPPSGGTRLPLFPLPDAVHFPRTHLRLLIEQPPYRRLVRELVELDEESRRVGVVLLKPAPGRTAHQPPEIFPGGTAGRLVDVEFLPNGRIDALLYGEFRFQVTGEVGGQEPVRPVEVRRVFDPPLNEEDAGLLTVRRAVVSVGVALAEELGERFPMSGAEIEEIGGRCGFEEMINRIAADLDLPAVRKQHLLSEAVPERALSLLSILRGRRQVIDLLRPYRHLAGGSDLN
ncbi:MAG TPA: LON peptidase substrate-binding domain-containing protein [Thermoanaerobaculia bacterium]|nr:LON peptidase substrate-binding domain-containing protein [Thermoanaerobaculia bacterium]